MLENVNAINVNAENVLNSLVQNFGDLGISTCDGGVIKLQVKELGNGDILNISNMLQWADIKVKRSNTSILVLFIPKPSMGPYIDEVLESIKGIEERECI